MSQEFLELLFEPFTMEGRSRAQGTGLGMSIVKSIVTLLGGRHQRWIPLWGRGPRSR